GLVERGEGVAGGEERDEAEGAVAEHAVADGASGLNPQAVPRREEEVSHRVGAGHGSLAEHVHQIAPAVEQDGEELVPYALVGLRDAEGLHDEEEERVPAVQAVLP